MSPALVALAGPTFAVVWAAGLLDLALRRGDLAWPARLAWAAAIVLLTPLGALAYALSRPVPVDRTVVGEAGARPELSPRAAAPLGLRALQQIARMASRGLFRSVEVVRPATVATSGPQLWFASHFGAFSDPIVLLHALERRPRFLAKHTLWRVPVAGRILDLAGAIPVQRRHEGGGAQPELFAATTEALAAGQALCIFPEGTATDASRLAPLRTGAARMALAARAAGTAGAQLVPVGIHYQDKAALRSRVLVEVGEPVDLDAWLRAQGADPDQASDGDRALVRALTDELEARLRLVAPEFADHEEAAALQAAARIARAEASRRAPSYGRVADLADELGRRDADERAAIRAALTAYRAELEAAGLTDRDVAQRPRRSRRRLLAGAALWLLAVPVAAAGLVVHAPLLAAVKATAWPRWTAIRKATLRPLVAVVGALATWLLWAWALSGGDEGLARAAAVATWLLVLPVWGAVALLWLERAALVLTARRRRAGGADTDVLAAVRRDRARLVALVEGRAPSD